MCTTPDPLLIISRLLELVGILATLLGGAYRLGRQDRELRVVRQGIALQLRKSGSIHPPPMPSPMLAPVRRPRKREQSVADLERAIAAAEKETG